MEAPACPRSPRDGRGFSFALGFASELFRCLRSKGNTMNRRTTLAMTTTALLCLAVGLSATASLAQQKSLKEQLVGHLDTRLVGSGALGWQQGATVWRQSEGYQRLRRERTFFPHDREFRFSLGRECRQS